MADSPEPHGEVNPRLSKEYEDPHFHDEEPATVDDGEQPRGPRPVSKGKKPMRLPPPRRRFTED
jgi:hypothetical protein